MRTFSGIPRTVDQAVEQVLSGWSSEETKSFSCLKPCDLFDLRNTLGADIRNVFSLWYGNDELLNDCDVFLTKNYEAYHQSFKVSIDTNDFLDEDEDLEEEEDDELHESILDQMFPQNSYTKDPDIPIDPYIASQVIIFAVWKHLQENLPPL